MPFQSTQPASQLGSARSAEFVAGRASEETLDSIAGATRLSSLTPSLMADLQRFGSETGAGALDMLAMLAASVRHGRALRATVQVEQHQVPITLFPTARVAHSPVPMV